MKTRPSVISVRPSISNTDTITNLKLTTPASDYSMVENPVLYGGSSLFRFNSNQSLSILFPFIDKAVNEIDAEFYVLNRCIVIWLTPFNRGVEINYRSLILHALTTIDGEECIYLQIESGESSGDTLPDDTIELFIKPQPRMEQNQLFKELKLVNIIHDTYEALSLCTSYHLDPSSSEEDDNITNTMVPSFEISEQDTDYAMVSTDRDNVADDLSNDDVCDGGIDGSAVVDIGVGPIAGTVRSRDDDDDDDIDSSKFRKI